MADYSINGTNLDDPARRWIVLRETSLPAMGAPTLASVEVPGHDGLAPIGATVGGAGQVSLEIAVTDRNSNGNRVGTRAQIQRNYDALIALLQPRGLVTIQFAPEGDAGLRRVTTARLSNALQPEYEGHSSAKAVIKVQVVYELLKPWTGAFDYTFTIPTTGTSVPLTTLSGSTARTAARLIITDPSDSVTVTDVTSGLRANWSRGRTRHQAHVTQFLKLDLTNWDCAYVSSDSAWTEAGTDATMGLNNPAGGFYLTPRPSDGSYVIAVSGGASSKLQARRAFL